MVERWDYFMSTTNLERKMRESGLRPCSNCGGSGFVRDENLKPTLERLIETVQEQGCVKLKSGEEGIPRSITITPEGEEIYVHTDAGHDVVSLDEIQEIVFVG